MAELPEIPSGAQLYLRPAGFLSAAFCGPNALAIGGTQRAFAAVEVIIAKAGDRLMTWLAPVASLDDLAADLPPPLGQRLNQLLANIAAGRGPLVLPSGGKISFSKPLIMGVLNVTPDSFSDGGNFLAPEAAIAHAKQLAEAGADIIDIGGESTRPGALTVWEGEEMDRVLPVIEALRDLGVPLSIDTRRASVMRQALEAGAQIINDISALTADPESLEVAAQSAAPVVLMHSQGDPQTMQDDPRYADVLLDVYDYLDDRVEAALAAGIKRQNIIVDPGIGFGKTVRHSIALINGLGLFQGLGCGLQLGVSRKRFIGALSREEPAQERLGGSLAAGLQGLSAGVHILRVHDVEETRQALAVIRGLADVSYLPPGID
ncbi:MAG: dihydropteroate synthase [Proteobacteria bacterium]|nr:dihydropteroate synthase [Pseudomonadota bacterium]